jgi:acyl-coenzyme A synthetase/AMP-(fatty) acid ligase
MQNGVIAEAWEKQIDGSRKLLHLKGTYYSVQEINELAKQQSPLFCPVIGDFFLAQGNALDIIVALVAGLHKRLPVQLVEKDRERRVSHQKLPQGTFLIKQTVGASGVRRCQFFTQEQLYADVSLIHRLYHHKKVTAVLQAISPAHSYGLTVTVMQAICYGLMIYSVDSPLPNEIEDLLESQENWLLPSVPAIWKAWGYSQLNFKKVAMALSAGSPLSLALEQQYMSLWGLKLHNLYGTSETGVIAFDEGDHLRDKEDYLGKVVEGVEVRIHQGRLWVKSPATALGYDEIHAEELLGDNEHLTWDAVEISKDQSLYWRKCLGAGINVAGRKLSPMEIAEKIQTVTGVKSVKVSAKQARDLERVEDIVVEIEGVEITQEFKVQSTLYLAPWEVPRVWVQKDKTIQ